VRVSGRKREGPRERAQDNPITQPGRVRALGHVSFSQASSIIVYHVQEPPSASRSTSIAPSMSGANLISGGCARTISGPKKLAAYAKSWWRTMGFLMFGKYVQQTASFPRPWLHPSFGPLRLIHLLPWHQVHHSQWTHAHTQPASITFKKVNACYIVVNSDRLVPPRGTGSDANTTSVATILIN